MALAEINTTIPETELSQCTRAFLIALTCFIILAGLAGVSLLHFAELRKVIITCYNKPDLRNNVKIYLISVIDRYRNFSGTDTGMPVSVPTPTDNIGRLLPNLKSKHNPR